VSAAKNLIDLRFESDIDCVFRFFDDGIEDNKAPAVLEHAQHFADNAGRVAEMMQAEGNKRAIEHIAFERQLIGLAGALRVVRDRIFMLVADVEHRLGLIDADDAAVFDLLGERPGDASGTGGEIENHLVTLEGQHLDQLVGERAANAGQRAPIEFRGVRRIVKARLVFVVLVVSVRMTVAMTMVVPMLVVVRVSLGVRVLVFVTMFVRMTVTLFRPVTVRVSLVAVLMIVMGMFVSVLVRMLALVRVLVIVIGFAVFVFVTHRLPRFSCASSTLRGEALEPKLTHKAAILQVARRQATVRQERSP